MRNKQDELEALVFFWSILLVLVGLDGLCPMTGVLGWRAIGCYGRIGRAGKVGVLRLCREEIRPFVFRDYSIERFWVIIKRTYSKADIVMGVCLPRMMSQMSYFLGR